VSIKYQSDPTYWKTFYVIQALLLNELPTTYKVPNSSYDESPLNAKSHRIATMIHESYA